MVVHSPPQTGERVQLYVTQACACFLAVSAKPVPVIWVLIPFPLKGARAPEEMAVSRTGGRKVQNELRIYVNMRVHARK